MKNTTGKRILWGLVGLIAIALVLITYIRFFLPNVEAAPYLKIESSPERIERGRYLSHNVAVCMDCHSSRDWSRFSGPLVDGSLGMGGEFFNQQMGFPGEFYARNLTPTNLGNWTDGEIFRAVTTGVSRDGTALFPVMPYLYYGKMDKEDIYDIIAYLRTLPPIENKTPSSSPDFPMNFIINTIPQEGSFSHRPESSDKVAYGRYLVNASSCVECHTASTRGKLDMERAFAGGREFIMPKGILRSSNITPDLKTGIGSWSENTFVERFTAYDSSHPVSEVGPEEFNTIMPWTMYAGMKSEDLKAIYTYLQTLTPIENEVSFWEPVQ